MGCSWLYWTVLGCTGLIGWGGHWSGGSGGPVIQVVQVVRMTSIDDMPSENIWFYGLNHQIMEKS